jgi:hypothetical protein
MNYKNLAIGLMLAICVQAKAVEFSQLKDSKSTKKFSQHLMELVSQDKLDDAFNNLKLHWPMAEGELDNLLLHTKKQRMMAVSRFGQPIGTEFVKTETVNNSLVRYTFLEKFQYHALRWQFAYYNNNEKWVVNAVYWDDDISKLY